MTILAVTRAIDRLNGTPHKLHQSATDTAMGCSSVRIGSAGSDLLRKRGGQAQTVVTVINLPAVVIDNQCNGEPVALRGRLLTVVTTHPTPNGGTTVRSVSVTQGLEGTGLVSGASYRAVELSGTVVNQLPPPGTGTFLSTVTTRLIPQGSAAPSMLLVVVLKGTVAPDGTISNEVVQTYLVCRPTARAGPPSVSAAWRAVRPTWQQRAGRRDAGGWLGVGPGTRRPRHGRSWR